jgi:hypothetical protein
VFENKLLRKVFRLKKDEVREQFRLLHNEKLTNTMEQYPSGEANIQSGSQ